MPSAEGTRIEAPKPQSGVGLGGVSPSQPTRGFRRVVSSPSGVQGEAPVENAFLTYFLGHRTLLADKKCDFFWHRIISKIDIFE